MGGPLGPLHSSGANCEPGMTKSSPSEALPKPIDLDIQHIVLLDGVADLFVVGSRVGNSQLGQVAVIQLQVEVTVPVTEHHVSRERASFGRRPSEPVTVLPVVNGQPFVGLKELVCKMEWTVSKFVAEPDELLNSNRSWANMGVF